MKKYRKIGKSTQNKIMNTMPYQQRDKQKYINNKDSICANQGSEI